MKINKIFNIKLLIIFIIAFHFIANNFLVLADTVEPAINSPACILININTGKILYSKNANEKMYPASTTKVMTAILALENCKLTDIATVSHNAVFSVPSGYSIASLREGEQLTINQLLNVLLIPSANDAAFVLAEHIGGSVSNFADMMNKKAVEIGCKNTHFVNPNGIHDENHYSTAYDLALIGEYAMKFDVFKSIVSMQKYTLPATNVYDKEDRIFNTTNELIKSNSKYYYKYATGCKTGYTEAAKYCIIATAKKDNEELIAVVLNDTKTDDGISTREVDCKTLFEYGFNNFLLKTMYSKGDVIETVKIQGASSDTKYLELATDADITAYIHNDYDLSSIETNISLNDNLSAPIAKGSTIGSINYIIDGTSYTSNLIATRDVYKSNILKNIFELLLVIILLILFANMFKNKKKKRKKNKKAKSISHSEYYTKHK